MDTASSWTYSEVAGTFRIIPKHWVIWLNLIICKLYANRLTTWTSNFLGFMIWKGRQVSVISRFQTIVMGLEIFESRCKEIESPCDSMPPQYKLIGCHRINSMTLITVDDMSNVSPLGSIVTPVISSLGPYNIHRDPIKMHPFCLGLYFRNKLIKMNNYFIKPLTTYNWQKWKRVFPTCPCHEIYKDDAVCLKSYKYTFKNYDFCEYVEFGAISWKFDILSITAWLKFESINSFAHVWHI